MLEDFDVEFNGVGNPGKALVWIIDGDCLYDIPVKNEHVSMFLKFDSLEDVSNEYPSHEGIAVRFIKDQMIIDDLLTSEYFGSILLSSPEVLDLCEYPYGRYVRSPYAKFDGEKFDILDMDTTGLMPFYS